MKTFETEKGNIPEGATHYREETNRDSFAWVCFYPTPKLTIDGVSISGVDLAVSGENLNNLKPIPQTNIETPEEKEALDSINSNLIKPREPSKPVITKVEWGGAGLPAVGVECEAVFIKYEHKGYGKFLILGYHDNYVWMEYIGELSNKSRHYTAKVDMVKFRKPETEAERVERERLENGESYYNKVVAIEREVTGMGADSFHAWGGLSNDYREVYARQAEMFGYRKESE